MLHQANVNPRNAADEGEQRAFRQQLANQPAAARAERRAHRELASTRRCARQQQIADVRAHHQKEETDDAEQHQQRRANVADRLLAQ